MDFDHFLHTILCTMPFAVEYSVCMGIDGCVWTILWKVVNIDSDSWKW